MVDAIIDFGRELAIIKNEASKENQGILFGKAIDLNGDTVWEAWAFSEEAFVRIQSHRELDYPTEKPYYNYQKEAWTENTSDQSIEDLRRFFSNNIVGVDDVARSRGKADRIAIPVVNLLETIGKLYNNDESLEFINKSRTILKNNNGFVFDDEIILTYDANHDVFFHPDLPDAAFYPKEKHSNLSGSFIDQMKYRCIILEEPEENRVALVDVRDEYFKGIEFLIHESKGVYYPKSEREVLDSGNYPLDRILRIPYVLEQPKDGYTFEPYHLETPALFYALRMMRGYRYAYFDISNQDRVSPILISGVLEQGMTNMPDIDVLIAPLDPKIRGFVR